MRFNAFSHSSIIEFRICEDVIFTTSISNYFRITLEVLKKCLKDTITPRNMNRLLREAFATKYILAESQQL